MKNRKLAERFESLAAKYQYWLLGGGLLVGALLRLVKLGNWSIWFDESFTSSVVRDDIATGVAITARDVHPPLYYLLLKAWGAIFGYSDVAMRSFSVVCSLVAALIIYGLLRRLFGKYYLAFGGFLAVLIGPFGVRYAQEARMYMLATIFIALATWAFHNLMEKDKPSRRDKVVYSLSIAGALYTHYFTFPIVFAHILYAYIFHYKGRRFSLKGLKQFTKEKKAWWRASWGAAFLYLPWLPIAAYQFTTVASGFWIGKVTILDPFYTFFFFLFNTSADRMEFEYDKTAAMFATVAAATFLVSLIIVVVGLLWEAKTEIKRALSLLALTSIVPIIILFFISIDPLQSFYVHRYFIYFGMIWYGFLGVVLLLKFPKILAWLKAPMIAFTVASFAIGLGNVYRLGNFNYTTWQVYGSKPLMEIINQNFTPGDVILTNDIFTFYDAMHYNQTGSTVLADDSKEGTEHTPYLEQFPDQLVRSPEDVDAKRVWFLSLEGDTPEAADNWYQRGEAVRSEHAKLTLYEIYN